MLRSSGRCHQRRDWPRRWREPRAQGVSLTVHVRAVDPARRQDVLHSAIEAARPWLDSGALKLLEASEAVELLPNIPWTKGDAVRWIVEDIETRARQKAWCIFFGDDVTDEEAFRAVRDGLTVVVGQRPSLARLRLELPSRRRSSPVGRDQQQRARKGGPAMTSADLVRTMADRLRDTKLVVVANRQPYVHEKRVSERKGLKRWVLGQGEKVRIDWKQPASGLVTALDPVMRACGGTWVAHGSGSGDREASDRRAASRCRPTSPSYTLRRVWLSRERREGYYYGVRQQCALAALSHRLRAAEFNESDWRQYSRVNRRFADTVLEEIAGTARDRVRAGLPLRAAAAVHQGRAARRIVCQFWHIPWPNPEAFRSARGQRRSSTGCSATICCRFTSSTTATTSSRPWSGRSKRAIDYETFAVVRGGHRTGPAVSDQHRSVHWNGGPSAHGRAKWRATSATPRRRRSTHHLGRRSPRLHEGHPDRLRAFERFLENTPSGASESSSCRSGAEPRSNRSLSDLTPRGGRAGRDDQRSARHAGLAADRLSPRAPRPARRLRAVSRRDVCVVSSLHDGMNLVAKEFVAARTDNRGVLVLSKFTGAGTRAVRRGAGQPVCT